MVDQGGNALEMGKETMLPCINNMRGSEFGWFRDPDALVPFASNFHAAGPYHVVRATRSTQLSRARCVKMSTQ